MAYGASIPNPSKARKQRKGIRRKQTSKRRWGILMLVWTRKKTIFDWSFPPFERRQHSFLCALLAGLILLSSPRRKNLQTSEIHGHPLGRKNETRNIRDSRFPRPNTFWGPSSSPGRAGSPHTGALTSPFKKTWKSKARPRKTWFLDSPNKAFHDFLCRQPLCFTGLGRELLKHWRKLCA